MSIEKNKKTPMCDIENLHVRITLKQKPLKELVKTWDQAELKSAIDYQGYLLSEINTSNLSGSKMYDSKRLEKANSDYRIFKKEYNKRVGK